MMLIESDMAFDQDEYERWMAQAEHTLKSAIGDVDDGDYGWACFKAQQAAEYAVKGLLYGLGVAAIGHSILRLLGIVESKGVKVSDELKRKARLLDRHYIPTRYVNAHVEGSPFEYYDRETAEESIRCSREILEFVKSTVSEIADSRYTV